MDLQKDTYPISISSNYSGSISSYSDSNCHEDCNHQTNYSNYNDKEYRSIEKNPEPTIYTNQQNECKLNLPIKFVVNNVPSKVNNRFIPNHSIHKNTFNLFIAELSNSKEYAFKEKDNTTDSEQCNFYNFNPIYLNMEEFKNIFFNSTSRYFNISDNISEKIKLSNQVFENINNETEPFQLSTFIQKIYTEKNNYNIMDANILIDVVKECKNFISLYNFNYIVNCLNLDDILYIINQNNIDTKDVKIRIKVYYKSEITNIPCIMYFNYIVKNIM